LQVPFADLPTAVHFAFLFFFVVLRKILTVNVIDVEQYRDLEISVRGRDGFEDSMFEAEASSFRGQGQGQFSLRPRPRPVSLRPKPRTVVMIVEKRLNNDISHQNKIVKLTTKRLSKHKLSTNLSLSLHHAA